MPRLREPPKYWRRSKRSYYILTYVVVSFGVGFLLYFYTRITPIPTLVAVAAILLQTLYWSVDFKGQPFTKHALFPIIWGTATAVIVGAVFSYLVLGRVGLREPYLALVAVVTGLAALVAILDTRAIRKVLSPQKSDALKPRGKEGSPEAVKIELGKSDSTMRWQLRIDCFCG